MVRDDKLLADMRHLLELALELADELNATHLGIHIDTALQLVLAELKTE